jgi:OmpA-like transmembrane domain
MRARSSRWWFNAAIFALCVGSVANADDLRGFYAGASLGRAELQLEDADSRYDFDGNDTGYQFIAGYRILKWVAVEANYMDYGRPKDDVVGIDLEGQFTSYSLSAVGLWPIRDFDLFARAGIAHWDGSLKVVRTADRTSENHEDALFGFGTQYRMGNLALRLEAENLLLGFDDDGDDRTDGDDWLSLYSVGFTYRFR